MGPLLQILMILHLLPNNIIFLIGLTTVRTLTEQDDKFRQPYQLTTFAANNET